MGLVAVSPMLI